MLKLQRYENNPIFFPHEGNAWEESGSYNGSVAKLGDSYHLLYRALAKDKSSLIGHATGSDFTQFANREVFIKPDSQWDKYGCEDPRVTQIGNSFYIFYTGLSNKPLTPDGIKVCLAKTQDFKNIQKHPVTTFNSKAMALFPQKVKGKYLAILTISTDRPPLPSKMALAYFDKEEELWSKDYWNAWFNRQDEFTLPLLRDPSHQVELGAAPIWTEAGWLLIYSYTLNYFTDNKTFGVEAALLDLNDPHKLLGRSSELMLTPEKDYELYGEVPRVVFPSGAIESEGRIWVYYGAADSVICLAWCDRDLLIKDLLTSKR